MIPIKLTHSGSQGLARALPLMYCNALFGTVVNLGVTYTPKAFKGKAQMRGSIEGVGHLAKGIDGSSGQIQRGPPM